MSCLILWDGCQEFSLYHHDLRLTSREGRDGDEEASVKPWRQKHTPPGASIRLIIWRSWENNTYTHRHTLTYSPTHMHAYYTHTHVCTSQMCACAYYENRSLKPVRRSPAYGLWWADRELKSTSTATWWHAALGPLTIMFIVSWREERWGRGSDGRWRGVVTT